jgi:hypothetical protein
MRLREYRPQDDHAIRTMLKEEGTLGIPLHSANNCVTYVLEISGRVIGFFTLRRNYVRFNIPLLQHFCIDKELRAKTMRPFWILAKKVKETVKNWGYLMFSVSVSAKKERVCKFVERYLRATVIEACKWQYEDGATDIKIFYLARA